MQDITMLGKNLKTIKSFLNETEKRTVFGNESVPLTMDDKKQFAETLRSFSSMAESVSGTRNLDEIVERISRMVETASRMISESDDDMLDKVAEGRRLKMIESALKDFRKSANEIMIHERRCQAAMDDIGEGLKKYYSVD
jgi:DNA repair ATPase RecN